MSTHMHTGNGKQKRMWADHKKSRARGESNWGRLAGPGANICNIVRPNACLNPLTHCTQNAMLMQLLRSAHGRG